MIAKSADVTIEHVLNCDCINFVPLRVQMATRVGIDAIEALLCGVSGETHPVGVLVGLAATQALQVRIT